MVQEHEPSRFRYTVTNDLEATLSRPEHNRSDRSMALGVAGELSAYPICNRAQVTAESEASLRKHLRSSKDLWASTLDAAFDPQAGAPALFGCTLHDLQTEAPAPLARTSLAAKSPRRPSFSGPRQRALDENLKII